MSYIQRRKSVSRSVWSQQRKHKNKLPPTLICFLSHTFRFQLELITYFRWGGGGQWGSARVGLVIFFSLWFRVLFFALRKLLAASMINHVSSLFRDVLKRCHRGLLSHSFYSIDHALKSVSFYVAYAIPDRVQCNVPELGGSLPTSWWC